MHSPRLSPRLTRSRSRRTRSQSRSRSPGAVSPLPPSSQPPESDFEDSGDDYESNKARERRILEKRAAKGYENPPNTDDEDLEDEESFLADIEENGYCDGDDTPKPKKKSQSQPKKAAKKAKVSKEKAGKEGGEKGGKDASEARKGRKGKSGKGGKGKAREEEAVYGVDPSDNERDSGDEDPGAHKAGHVPKAIQERLLQAYDAFQDAVVSLAHECGKSPTTLHNILGSVPKTSRPPSPWNMFQMWHAEAKPKAKESKFSSYLLSAFSDALTCLSSASQNL